MYLEVCRSTAYYTTFVQIKWFHRQNGEKQDRSVPWTIIIDILWELSNNRYLNHCFLEQNISLQFHSSKNISLFPNWEQAGLEHLLSISTVHAKERQGIEIPEDSSDHLLVALWFWYVVSILIHTVCANLNLLYVATG